MGDSGPIAGIKGIVEDVVGKGKEIAGIVISNDNLRKGAALNAIQIAECLINRGLIKPRAKAA